MFDKAAERVRVYLVVHVRLSADMRCREVACGIQVAVQNDATQYEPIARLTESDPAA